ncbi:Transferase [Penicillium antarcticum]|uniref:Transferase n=1 Tax=Penicillium antarcticum TaxID=416450 RepID=UPI0023887426|nr:Transferase [Penicillium antarcticum]KAJ5306479.1 Transferase [Penicillium antarcticum]
MADTILDVAGLISVLYKLYTLELLGDGNTGVFIITPLGKIQLVVKDIQDDPSAPTTDGLCHVGREHHYTLHDYQSTRYPARDHNRINIGLLCPGEFHKGRPDAHARCSTKCHRHDWPRLSHQHIMLSRACHDEPTWVRNLLLEIWTRAISSHYSTPRTSRVRTITLPPTPSYISTDDAVSAFIWQCITRARDLRFGSKSELMLARAVDVRRHLGVHSGVIAAQLRSQLDPKIDYLVFNTRALATFHSRSPDRTKTLFTATVTIPSDYMISSWSRINCYELDLNLGLGKPEAVRSPHFIPFESLGYLMPRSPAGEILVAIWFRDEDWKRIRVNKKFVQHATYIGR